MKEIEQDVLGKSRHTSVDCHNNDYVTAVTIHMLANVCIFSTDSLSLYLI